MSYMTRDLNELRDDALRTGKAKGFTEATVGEDIALMHSELSEALEDHRTGHAPAEFWYESPNDGGMEHVFFPKEQTMPNKPCGIPSEMADVIIRVLHFCGKHDIDIARAVREKMFYNECRAFRHGGKTL